MNTEPNVRGDAVGDGGASSMDDTLTTSTRHCPPHAMELYALHCTAPMQRQLEARRRRYDRSVRQLRGLCSDAARIVSLHIGDGATSHRSAATARGHCVGTTSFLSGVIIRLNDSHPHREMMAALLSFCDLSEGKCEAYECVASRNSYCTHGCCRRAQLDGAPYHAQCDSVA